MNKEKLRRAAIGFCILLLTAVISVGCHETQTAVSCPGASDNSAGSKSGEKKRNYVSRHQKKSKGQDGFVAKDRKARRSAKKAEKGKKKERKETRVERKWHLLKKNRAAKNDATNKQKGNSRKSERKQKKENKKREKHPQNGRPPKGQV